MMTRKHYIAIASDLNRYARPYMDRSEFDELVRQISLTMKEDNIHHNMDRFADAANGR